MKKRWLLLLSFGLMVLLQLWTPAAMIWNRESVIEHGHSYKFRAAPVDPTDPFRGKYIVLSFAENSYPNTEKIDWKSGERVHVQMSTDSLGFARIKSLQKKPLPGADFVTTTVSYVSNDSSASVFINWPFDRFYMEESKAKSAEKAYNNSIADTGNVTYALVKVKRGDAVLEDVFINNKPIVTYIK